MGNSVYDCRSPLASLSAAHSYGRQELKCEILMWTCNVRAPRLLINFAWLPASSRK